MAGMKRGREFGASFEQQLKAFKPVKANPFTKMMEAARTLQLEQDIAAFPQAVFPAARPAANQGDKGAPGPAEPCTCCTHCGCGLTELQVQQCHACKNVYCSSCSVVNYDAREDRIFCLDCHPHHVATCSSHDDYCMYDQHDILQYDDVAFDRTQGSSRDIQAQSNSKATLIRACSQAAVAAASTAATCNTPFCCFGASPQANHGFGGASGFGCSQSPYATAAGRSGSTAAGAGMSCSSQAASNSWAGFGSTTGAAARGSSRGFGISSDDVLAGWDVSSPSALGKAGAGQLLATSPVIPFVAVEGYCLASRAVEAAVMGC